MATMNTLFRGYVVSGCQAFCITINVFNKLLNKNKEKANSTEKQQTGYATGKNSRFVCVQQPSTFYTIALQIQNTRSESPKVSFDVRLQQQL